MDYGRYQRALAARAIKRRLNQDQGGSGGGTGLGVGSGGPGDGDGGGPGDGDGGKSGSTPDARDFVFTLVDESGVTYTMDNESATSMSLVERQWSGIWWRFRQRVGNFDVRVYLHSTSTGVCYTIMNSFGDDEIGSFPGYLTSCSLTVENVEVDILTDLGGGDKHIILSQQAITGRTEDYTIRRNHQKPDVRSWLDAAAEDDKGAGEATIGQRKLWPSTDINGNGPGGVGVGYYYTWFQSSKNALELWLARAEAAMNRHRVFRTYVTGGGPRLDDTPHSQIYADVELGWNGSAWTQNTKAIHREYQTKIPTGLCPYEETLGTWNSFDGQHQRRIASPWEVIEHWDPRAPDLFNALVFDVKQRYVMVNLTGETSSTDANGDSPGNVNLMSIPRLKEYAATNPSLWGAPGKGITWLGREFAHAVHIIGRWGPEDTYRQQLRDFIREYWRFTETVEPGESTGHFWFNYEGQSFQDRTLWPTSLGSTATPPNPAAVKTREIQFLAMALKDLGGCADLVQSYEDGQEPWPLRTFRLDNPLAGTTDEDASPSVPGYLLGNDGGVTLADWYSLAFGNYHTSSGVDEGLFTDAAALYAFAVNQTANQDLDENMLSQCPEYMWSSAV